jgi:hypothetical protein
MLARISETAMVTPRLDADKYVIPIAKRRRRPILLLVSDTILASLVLGKLDYGLGTESIE